MRKVIFILLLVLFTIQKANAQKYTLTSKYYSITQNYNNEKNYREYSTKDANFEDIGYSLYDDVIFEQYNVLGLVKGSHTDCCDYYGNIKSVFDTSRFRENYYDQNYNNDDRDMGDPSWRDLGSQEEDYIINNGGDWILDT